jgi:hypothetical protein
MPSTSDFGKLSFSDASKALETKTRDDQAKGWRGERAPAANEPLMEFTTSWIDSLPLSLRPVALARDFPRIANTIAVIWKRPARADEYFQQLLLDNRGGRKGFPPDVAMELSKLAAHHAALFPYRRSIWDDVIKK